jgi:hypothetical protein
VVLFRVGKERRNERNNAAIGGTKYMLATDVSELRQDEQQQGAKKGMPDQIDHGNGTGSDDVLKALGELESVLRENAESERLLAKRIADVRLARENGREWKAILGDEDEPGTVQLVSTILRRQSEASGYLRRSLVVALRAEGQSIPSIAHLFGVTHQRVSNLLRRVAQGNAAADSNSD